MKTILKKYPTYALLGLFYSGLAFSAPKKGGSVAPSMSTSSNGKKGVDRDYLLSLPVVAETPQARLHLEYNIESLVGIALEGGILGDNELLSRKEIEEKGNSLTTKGVQGALLFSRYSEPSRLGGFFWTLGGGYRQYTAEWKKKPNEKENDLRLDSTDGDGYLHHRIEGRGTFGTARVGYRYVASEWPVSIGGHLGVRHMTSTVVDKEVDQEEQTELKLNYSPTTPEEKKTIRNSVMTTPDVTIDVGLIF